MIENAVFSIQLVSKLTGLSVHTLRTWEKRYTFVKPKRLTNGRRQYSKTELDQIWVLSELVKMGFSIGEIANYDKELLESLYRQHTGKKFSKNQNLKLFENPKEDFEQCQKILLKAIQGYKLNIITNELIKISKLINHRQLALNVLVPLVQEIGNRVMSGKLTMSQEHALSALIRFHVGPLLFAPQNDRKRKVTKIILSTPTNELHEFGIIVSALLCHFHAVEFMFLGTNLPATSIADTLEATGFDMVIFGTTLKLKEHEKKKLTKYMDDLFDLIPKNKKVVIGGPKVLDESVYNSYKNLQHINNFEELDQFLIDTI